MTITYDGNEYHIHNPVTQQKIFEIIMGLDPNVHNEIKERTSKATKVRQTKKRTYTKWTDEDKLRIAMLYEGGERVRDIADTFQTSSPSISSLVQKLHKQGLIKAIRPKASSSSPAADSKRYAHKPWQKWTNDEENMLITLYLQGMKPKAIEASGQLKGREINAIYKRINKLKKEGRLAVPSRSSDTFDMYAV